MTKTVRAHTNIALIKYWGKKNRSLKIPYNSSISLTLDQFYTDTSVEYDESLKHDEFYLDGQSVDDHKAKRVYTFMDFIRKTYNLTTYARITSTNNVPTAAGLASSASAFAALAKAATLDLNLDDRTLSRLARQGSGSASRSIYGDFVKWERGHDDESSYAHPLNTPTWDEFRMIVCVINQGEKPFLSSEAMDETVEKSPYYEAWVKTTEADCIAMEDALQQRDIVKVGTIAQTNAMRMHASLLAINKWYFEPMTLDIMNRVREMQKSIPAYFTMDAGPNVKIMTTAEHVDAICAQLPDEIDVVVCEAGPGVYVL